ncbi:MAG TPA: class I SAM-dependent methyltransferase [Thermoplasmata archaeon]|nr:class I SAM-dependent methyltransferase [Thermoplasmata archaeon]
MYHVARNSLVRVTGRPASELDGYFQELAPLQAELLESAGGLPTAGALIQAPLLYVLARALRPKRLVETGISSGYSARLLLEALERNGEGHLTSIGIDMFGATRRPGEAPTPLDRLHVGWLVPNRLKDRWTLLLGRSEEQLPPLVPGGRRDIDLFLHDSLHQYATMRWEYATAFPALAPGGLLCSHDIHANRAWPEFLQERSLTGDEELDHDLGVVRMRTEPHP